MHKPRFRFILPCLLLTGLAACESAPVNREKLLTEPHFWQRSEASSAIYQRGPKAQQMLSRDIARCVTEIRELERLGAIRYITPGEMTEYGLVPDPDTPAGSLAEWEEPDRDGYLRAEYLDYDDFETCMMDKGWERINYVPYSVAEESRSDYIDAVLGEHYQTRSRQREPFVATPKGDFEGQNP